jgi:hypothetical protein
MCGRVGETICIERACCVVRRGLTNGTVEEHEDGSVARTYIAAERYLGEDTGVAHLGGVGAALDEGGVQWKLIKCV